MEEQPSYYNVRNNEILANLKLEIKSYIENEYIRNLPRWWKNKMWINVLLCILFPFGFPILTAWWLINTNRLRKLELLMRLEDLSNNSKIFNDLDKWLKAQIIKPSYAKNSEE